MRALQISCFLALSPFAVLAPAFAHKADYIDDTLVFETLETGEVEPEYFLDLGRRTREDASGTSFQRHTIAIEYGITDHWMIDARAAFDADAGSALGIENFHVESRYRFLDEGTLPIDIALSAELFWEAAGAGGDDVYGVTPRLILSKDFGAANLTLNLTEEIPLYPASSDAELEIALGARYTLSERVWLGSELKYAPDSHEGAVIPQVAFSFPHDITLKVGYSRELERNEESFLRGVFEIEF